MSQARGREGQPEPQVPRDPLGCSARGLAMIDDPATLDEGLRLLRLAVAHTPEGDPARATRLLNLGVAADLRWRRDGARADLEDAIGCYRQAAADADPELRGACLVNLCHALRIRHSMTGLSGDLDAAVDAGVACLRATPATDGRRADRLEQLAHAYRERYDLGRDFADLDAAVSCYREAASADAQSTRTARPAGPATAATTETTTGTSRNEERLTGRALVHARNYALATRTRYEAGGDADRLPEAVVAALRLAADPAAAGHVQWAARHLLNSGADVADIDHAAAALRRVAGAVSGSDEVSVRVDLVAALRRHAELTGRAEDTETAVAEAHHAADVADIDGSDEDRQLALAVLGGAQLTQYERTGTLAHLDDAIASLRAADARAAQPDAICATNLSNALLTRYDYLHEPDDLDQAIDASRRALALIHPDDAARTTFAANVARALWLRYEASGSTQDIGDAIDTQRLAVDVAPANTVAAATAEAQLGVLYQERFHRAARPEDLAQAVRLGRAGLDGLAATRAGAARMALQMINLALALAQVYRCQGQQQALDEAVDLAARAAPLLAGTERRHRGVAGTLLGERFHRDGDISDARAALGHLRAAAETVEASTLTRVDAATVCARLARDTGDASGAAAAFALAIDLLPPLSSRGTSRATRERALASVAGLASDAAAGALDVADSAAAVSLLERGRSVLWAQQLELRGDLNRLAAADPALAGRVEVVRQRLDDGTR